MVCKDDAVAERLVQLAPRRLEQVVPALMRDEDS